MSYQLRTVVSKESVTNSIIIQKTRSSTQLKIYKSRPCNTIIVQRYCTCTIVWQTTCNTSIITYDSRTKLVSLHYNCIGCWNVKIRHATVILYRILAYCILCTCKCKNWIRSTLCKDKQEMSVMSLHIYNLYVHENFSKRQQRLSRLKKKIWLRHSCIVWSSKNLLSWAASVLENTIEIVEIEEQV